MTLLIDGHELKPCGMMYTKTKGIYVNLMTRCSHDKCWPGCFTGKGNCADYIPAKRISANMRHIAGVVADFKILKNSS